MNRRHFFHKSTLAGLSLGLPSVLRAEKETEPKADKPGDTPAVYAPTDSGATILLPLAEKSIGWIEYGVVGETEMLQARHDGFGFVPGGAQVLRVRLQGLIPGKTYWYRVVTRSLLGPNEPTLTGRKYTLNVLNPAAAETCFCVWNDTHNVPLTLANLAKLTQAEPAEFLIWNGDVSNNINREEDIASLYLQPKPRVNLAEGPPILLVHGNHDVRGLAASSLPRYVDHPNGRPFHAFRSGPVGIVILDTGEDKPDDHPSFNGLVNFTQLIREQANWLEKEIAKPYLRDAPYKVVFCHIPLRWKAESTPDYANGGFDHWSRRGRDAWHEALLKWGAQLVISGHTHHWAYLPAAESFPYAQLVGGGPGRPTGDGTDTPYLIRIQANSKELSLRMLEAASGAETFKVTFPSLA